MDLLSLWLPILLSAAVVWIVSAIVWMALPHHKQDFIAGWPIPSTEWVRDDRLASGRLV